MKERGIPMSAPMVRATLRDEDPKTQTRRILKPQPPMLVQSVYRPFPAEPNNWQGYGADLIHWYGRCPYGVPGDRLWVRETWANTPQYVSVAPYVAYRADYYPPLSDSPPGHVLTDGEKHWRPSIFMPRWASRITLEITEVRVERLQEISEEDALAEGVFRTHGGLFKCVQVDALAHETAQEAYRCIWNFINGAGSWDLNPWVWVVSFRRLR